MTVWDTGDELLKTDTLGRVRTSRARREEILDEFERSGGSGAQFAALLGIKYPTFASWRQGRRRERRLLEGGKEAMVTATPKSAPIWLEAVVEKEASAVDLQVRLPGGATVELTHPDQVRLLTGLLRELATGEASRC